MQIIDNIKNKINSLSVIELVDIFSLSVLISGIIYSPFLFTMGLIFMILRILFIGKVKQKILLLKKKYKILICLLSIYILNIIGLIWTTNIKDACFELNHKLPFLILPLFLLIISPIQKNILNTIIIIYITLIASGIIIGITHYIIDPYVDSRVLIPTARNISFAFHICFAISVMVIEAYKNRKLRKYFISLSLLFCAYLFIASLISGIVSIFILVFCGFIYILKKLNKIYSLIAIVILIFIISSSAYWLCKQYDNYFTPKEEFFFGRNKKTSLGNIYLITENKSIENGYYVNKYMCPKEVNNMWQKRTGLKLSDYCEGKQGVENYRYYNVIYRYLNSKGLRKDAKGVAQLSNNDIENIKRGYSNYIYAEKFSLRPRLYQTFYEFEHYLRTGEVEDMSIIQRYFWSKNAIDIIKKYPIFGCGTGDAKDELVAPVITKYPKLCTTGCNPHNQFIYMIVSFGILGFIVTVFYLFYLPTKLHLFRNKYFCAFFVISLCWMFAESSFESYEGMTFISLLMSLFCLNINNISGKIW
ncbi:MAG: O-antigen ligase family protein [Bacteroidales bacterium]